MSIQHLVYFNQGISNEITMFQLLTNFNISACCKTTVWKWSFPHPKWCRTVINAVSWALVVGLFHILMIHVLHSTKPDMSVAKKTDPVSSSCFSFGTQYLFILSDQKLNLTPRQGKCFQFLYHNSTAEIIKLSNGESVRRSSGQFITCDLMITLSLVHFHSVWIID